MVEEHVHHGLGVLRLGELRAEREHVGVVVRPHQFALPPVQVPSAARIPWTLLAAMDMPTPVEQTRMPRSARPEATSRATGAA